MLLNDELSKGQLTEKEVIDCWNELTNKKGVDWIYYSQMKKYDMVAEKVYRSQATVRRIMGKYFKGEIRY